MTPVLRSDMSGDIVTGYFYLLFTRNYTPDREIRQTSDWIVSGSKLEDRFVRAEKVRDKRHESHECPADPSHTTASYVTDIDIDLFGGDTVGPFVPLYDDVLVSAELAKQIEASALPGAHTIRARIRENQSGCTDPDIRLLQFRGKEPLRWPRVYPEDANHCPYCGNGPTICLNCGHRQAFCEKCGEDCFRTVREKLKGADDPRILIDADRISWTVVEPHRWDGSDFMSSHVITRRVLDFLLSVHAAPMIAEPLFVDLRGITHEKRELLEKAKQPVNASAHE